MNSVIWCPTIPKMIDRNVTQLKSTTFFNALSFVLSCTMMHFSFWYLHTFLWHFSICFDPNWLIVSLWNFSRLFDIITFFEIFFPPFFSRYKNYWDDRRLFQNNIILSWGMNRERVTTWVNYCWILIRGWSMQFQPEISSKYLHGSIIQIHYSSKIVYEFNARPTVFLSLHTR